MRKSIIILLCLSLLFLVGCSKELTPIEKARDRVVEIGEQVLNYEISTDEAYELLDELILPEIEFEVNGSSLYTGSLKTYIYSMKLALRDGDYEELAKDIKTVKDLG